MVSAVTEFDATIHLTKKLLRTIGLKPYDTSVKSENYLKHIQENLLFWVSFGMLAICVVGEIFYIFTSWGKSNNFLDVTSLAPCIIFCILSLSKMGTLAVHSQSLTLIFKGVRELWSSKSNEVERKVTYAYMRKAKITTTGFSILYMSLICIYNPFPIVVMTYEYWTEGKVTLLLPYEFWYPFNPLQHPIFEVLFVVQVWAGFVAAVGILSSDCLFCVLISHICMQFKLLGIQLSNIVDTNTYGETSSNNVCLNSTGQRVQLQFDHKVINENLRICLQRHIELIELSAALENIFSPSILINFVSSSLIICLVGFQATAVGALTLFKFILFLISSLVQIMMLCWHGNQLLENSTNVNTAAYNCLWYDTDHHFKKSLQILMIRAQRPQLLTALKFSVVSLQSFTTILSTSYSYFALLRTMYSED